MGEGIWGVEQVKILAGYYTNNKIRPKLLEESLKYYLKACQKENCISVVSSWEPIPNLSCPNIISKYKNNGHLNIILQLYHIIHSCSEEWDYFAFCEHDVLYPETYFTDAIQILLSGKYTGLISENHIGLRPNGYCYISSPTHPLFTLILSKEHMLNFLKDKQQECILDNLHCMEPDHREQWYFQKRSENFTPVIHINMDFTMNNHHLTNHHNFYKQSSFSTDIPYWGDYKKFNIYINEEIQQSTASTIDIGPIKILDAIYGDIEKEKTISYMDILRNLQDKKTFKVDNKLGDPACGIYKKLRIKFIDNDKMLYKDFDEGETVDISSISYSQFLEKCRKGFYINWKQLGDCIGFVSAASLLSYKVKELIKVHFQENRKDIISYFEGVQWVKKEEIPEAICCDAEPPIEEFNKTNGVKRFYKYMDPSMSPEKSFDIHMNCEKIGGEKLIGLISYSFNQGSIPQNILDYMIKKVKEKFPEHKIVMFGGDKDKTITPSCNFIDLRQDKFDISWLVTFMKRLDFLITPQNGIAFLGVGLRIPMMVYRSKKYYWDYILNNYDTYKVENWVDRYLPTEVPLSIIIPCSRPENLSDIIKSITEQETGLFKIKIIIMFDFERKEDISQNILSEVEKISNCEYHIWRIPRDDGKVHGKSINEAINKYVPDNNFIYVVDDDNLIYSNFFLRLSDIIKNNPGKKAIFFQQENRLSISENYHPHYETVDTAMMLYNKSLIAFDLPTGIGHDGLLGELLNRYYPDACLYVRQDLCFYNKLRTITNPLVVYTISGDDIHYKNICKNSIQSLLKYGEYTHDIIILTNNKHNWENFVFPNCKIIKCLSDDKNPCIQRIFIPQYIDLSLYSHLLYLDSDTLIMNNIYPLFKDTNNVLYAEEEQTIEQHIDNPGFCYNNLLFMTEEEKQKWKKEHTINSGHFVVPTKLFNSFFNNWKNILGTYNDYGPDQASLNTLIRRSIVPAKLMDGKYYCFSSDISCRETGTIINHFSISHRGEKYNTLVKSMNTITAYLINMNNRPDKLQFSSNECKRIDLEFTRFEAITTTDKGTFLCPEARGCTLSHLEIIKLAKQQNLPHVLILEDDVKFADNFREILDAVLQETYRLQWDIIFFYNYDGFCNNNNNVIKSVSNSLNMITGTVLAHCYLINRGVYDKIINNPPKEILDLYFKHSYLLMLATKTNVAFQNRDFRSDIPTSQPIKNMEEKSLILNDNGTGTYQGKAITWEREGKKVNVCSSECGWVGEFEEN